MRPTECPRLAIEQVNSNEQVGARDIVGDFVKEPGAVDRGQMVIDIQRFGDVSSVDRTGEIQQVDAHTRLLLEKLEVRVLAALGFEELLRGGYSHPAQRETGPGESQ